jgi:predicted nucleotidyltransferase component of viral defense system
MKNTRYFKQVELLISVLPDVLKDNRVALKGGTAINLFVNNMPRMSVDIDLVYVPLDDRESALMAINDIMLSVNDALHLANLHTELKYTKDKFIKQIVVSNNEATIKIEINFVLRGVVNKPHLLPLCRKAQDVFGRYVSVTCVNDYDLYAGKFCAALDRQHPRDLFDVMHFFKKRSYDRNLHNTFLVYLISHNRPIGELIQPNKQDITEVFAKEFKGMVEENVSVEALEKARADLIQIINESMTDKDKAFLVSFKNMAPDWSLLELDNIELMPAVQWKQYNLKKMETVKHKAALDQLKQKLY